MRVVTQTRFPGLELLSRGKVRDIYALDAEHLLIVTTDRMSAFDVVLGEPVPYKGVVLNQITVFWMRMFHDLVPNHLVATEVADFPPALAAFADDLEGRAVVVRRAKPLPIECIVRGYLTGSGYKDYLATGSVCGHKLPEGLPEAAKLTPPLFTPSTKADLGEHDENITVASAKARVGEGLVRRVQEISLAMYERARAYAEERGILIADTKFEFGLHDRDLMLIDEVLTPDSSRFWPKEGYTPGLVPPSFDKQYLRDWLSSSGWDKRPPAPKVPEEIILQTQRRYLDAYRILTGSPLAIPNP
ncbi:MAG: phosphoribosylaminoimidazole-succinocarboxamides ynthase [Desulfomicrobiaceae bacterium]|jgi:phosphoribosylaminoimidazole-succinocarboxamide synthase|nr:phosphoribosylaminoimidazole-succinocarboxamides ynthase [Desulfomicrobiaceae bacterium]